MLCLVTSLNPVHAYINMLKPAKLVKGYILQIVIKSVIKITMYKLTQIYTVAIPVRNP